jgi:molybdenum cofactor cytidylyltransferase
MVWAMILAAGESRRMGGQKLLLPFGDKTIIQTVIERVLASKVEKTLVVLGANREKIEDKINAYTVEIVFNADFSRGMLSSVQCGFQAVPKDVRALVVLLGDQPMIHTYVIDELIDSYDRTKKGIVIPVYNQRRGHPVLIDLKYRDEVAHLSHETGLRELVYTHPEDTHEIAVDTPDILRDIDDSEDYSREIEKHQQSSD